MIRRPPRSTLFPYTNALPISYIQRALNGRATIRLAVPPFTDHLAETRENASGLPNLLNLERCFQRSIHTANLFCLFNWQRFRFFFGTTEWPSGTQLGSGA